MAYTILPSYRPTDRPTGLPQSHRTSAIMVASPAVLYQLHYHRVTSLAGQLEHAYQLTVVDKPRLACGFLRCLRLRQRTRRSNQRIHKGSGAVLETTHAESKAPSTHTCMSFNACIYFPCLIHISLSHVTRSSIGSLSRARPDQAKLTSCEERRCRLRLEQAASYCRSCTWSPSSQPPPISLALDSCCLSAATLRPLSILPSAMTRAHRLASVAWSPKIEFRSASASLWSETDGKPGAVVSGAFAFLFRNSSRTLSRASSRTEP